MNLQQAELANLNLLDDLAKGAKNAVGAVSKGLDSIIDHEGQIRHGVDEEYKTLQEIADDTWLVVPARPSVLFDVPYDDQRQAAASILGIDLNLVQPTGLN